MLQSMRDHTQGWITWIIVILICFTFALWGIQNYLIPNPANDVVASVDGVDITRQTWMNTYRHMAEQQQQLFGRYLPLTDAMQERLKQQALDQLILSQLLIRNAKQQGFAISDEQVKSYLQQMPVFQENGKFSPQLLRQSLAAMNFNEAEFIEQVRADLLIQQVQAGFIDSAFTVPYEVSETIKLLDQKRDISYLIIPQQPFQADAVLSESDYQQYYELQKDQFKSPETVTLEYIELSIPALAAQHKALSQAEIEHLFAEKSEQLAQLSYENTSSLQAVADELDLPLQVSPPLSPQGLVNKNAPSQDDWLNNPQVISAAFSPELLDEDYNSDVISLNDDTQVVLRKKQHQLPKPLPLADVKPQIKTQLVSMKAERQAEAKGQQVIQALLQGESKDKIAKDFAVQWQAATDVERKSDKVDAAIIANAFQLPVSEPKQPPQVQGLRLPSGDYAIVMVNKIIPGNPEALSKQQIQTYSQNIAQANGQLEYELYVRSLKDTAKIKIFEQTPEEIA